SEHLDERVAAAGVGRRGLDLGEHPEEPALPAAGGGGGGGGEDGVHRATIIRRRDFVKQMSPRKYDMSRRASAAAATRRRIIDATRAPHTEQRIAETNLDALHARAGGGVGTVYRHFPTLGDLVPACGEVAMAIVAFP